MTDTISEMGAAIATYSASLAAFMQNLTDACGGQRPTIARLRRAAQKAAGPHVPAIPGRPNHRRRKR